MHLLPMYRDCPRSPLPVAEDMFARCINLAEQPIPVSRSERSRDRAAITDELQPDRRMSMPRVVFFTIHSTTPWWTYLGSQLNFADANVRERSARGGRLVAGRRLLPLLPEGRRGRGRAATGLAKMAAPISSRAAACLRSLDRNRAMRMIGGMAQAVERAFDELDPDLVMTFHDRSLCDGRDGPHRAAARHRFPRNDDVDHSRRSHFHASRPSRSAVASRRGADVDAAVGCAVHRRISRRAMCGTPSVSPRPSSGSVFGYFALRGAFFNLLRFIKRDPVNLHYLDALKRLKHKVRRRRRRRARAFRCRIGSRRRPPCRTNGECSSDCNSSQKRRWITG